MSKAGLPKLKATRRYVEEYVMTHFKKDIILHANQPASQEMVIFQMISVNTTKNPTNRSAEAKCLIKKFMRDLWPLEVSMAMSMVVLPTTMKTNRIHRKVNCSTW